jgi:hypothetical protein
VTVLALDRAESGWVPGAENCKSDSRYSGPRKGQRAFSRRPMPQQSAVLLMRDVRGFSVAEVTDQLASSAAAVSSAHPRARATLEQRMPHGSPVRPHLTPSLSRRPIARWR